MAETIVLSFLAPSARPLAPQVTALPPLAAYHDLRWLFAFNQSWLGFTAVFMLLVLARATVDAVLVQLAWPAQPDPGMPAPGKFAIAPGPPAARLTRSYVTSYDGAYLPWSQRCGSKVFLTTGIERPPSQRSFRSSEALLQGVTATSG